MNNIAIGKRIRKERLRMGLTQAQLAESVEISCAFVGQLERGERGLTMDTLVSLANKLSVTTDYLLMDDLKAPQDALSEQIKQLMMNKPAIQQQMALDMLKTMFSYLDNMDK